MGRSCMNDTADREHSCVNSEGKKTRSFTDNDADIWYSSATDVEMPYSSSYIANLSNSSSDFVDSSHSSIDDGELSNSSMEAADLSCSSLDVADISHTNSNFETDQSHFSVKNEANEIIDQTIKCMENEMADTSRLSLKADSDMSCSMTTNDTCIEQTCMKDMMDDTVDNVPCSLKDKTDMLHSCEQEKTGIPDVSVEEHAEVSQSETDDEAEMLRFCAKKYADMSMSSMDDETEMSHYGEEVGEMRGSCTEDEADLSRSNTEAEITSHKSEGTEMSCSTTETTDMSRSTTTDAAVTPNSSVDDEAVKPRSIVFYFSHK